MNVHIHSGCAGCGGDVNSAFSPRACADLSGVIADRPPTRAPVTIHSLTGPLTGHSLT